MTRKQLVLIGVVFAAIAALFVLVAWIAHRDRPDTTRWGQAAAVVIQHRTINLNRGTATVVRARYAVADVEHEADVLQVRDVWSGERFVTPADTPAVGSPLAVQVDPADPRAIVLAGLPRAPFMPLWQLVFVGTLSLLALICWIVPVRD